MIRHQSKTLSELNSESLDIEELMNKTKGNMDDQELDCEDCSELSLTSKPYSFIRNQQDERAILHSTVHRGTASGGILNSSQFSQKKIELKVVFPNFNSDNLYGEMPVDQNEIADDQIIFEGKNEMIGCCRMKFLCF
jgi:hypothetical protein